MPVRFEPIRLDADIEIAKRTGEYKRGRIGKKCFARRGAPKPISQRWPEPFRQWLDPRLTDGRYFGIVAEDDGYAIGGVGRMEIEWPPQFARRGITYVVLHAIEAGRPL